MYHGQLLLFSFLLVGGSSFVKVMPQIAHISYFSKVLVKKL